MMKIVCSLTCEAKRKFRKKWEEFYGMHCAYCTIDCSKRPTIDHIIPRSKGGNNKLENLVIACFECNNKKGGKSPKNFRRLMLQPLEKKNVMEKD